MKLVEEKKDQKMSMVRLGKKNICNDQFTALSIHIAMNNLFSIVLRVSVGVG